MSAYWELHPGFMPLSSDVFAALVIELKKFCRAYTYSMYGKSVASPRISVVVVPNVKEARKLASSKASFNYKKTAMISWDEAPDLLRQARKQVADELNMKIDYALVHIYRDRNDCIGYHNDKEAMKSDIASLSWGAARRFVIRELETKEAVDEYRLCDGDLFYMKGPSSTAEGLDGCQQCFEHCVPKMQVRDLQQHLADHSVPLGKGRNTYKKLDKLIEDFGLSLERVNVTFRQFE